jgi:hypothetical protein
VLQFMRLLCALVHQLQRRSKRMSIELGITGPQRLVALSACFPGRRPERWRKFSTCIPAH